MHDVLRSKLYLLYWPIEVLLHSPIHTLKECDTPIQLKQYLQPCRHRTRKLSSLDISVHSPDNVYETITDTDVSNLLEFVFFYSNFKNIFNFNFPPNFKYSFY